eukprot:6186909-Pleurochrysis_carterae.AAC.2
MGSCTYRQTQLRPPLYHVRPSCCSSNMSNSATAFVCRRLQLDWLVGLALYGQSNRKSVGSPEAVPLRSAPPTTGVAFKILCKVITDSVMNVVGAITGVVLWSIVRDKTRFTKRLESFPQRDTVATDESAADKRADVQIDRSSGAPDACTLEFTHLCYGYNKWSGASMQQLRTTKLAATVAARAPRRRWAPKISAS